MAPRLMNLRSVVARKFSSPAVGSKEVKGGFVVAAVAWGFVVRAIPLGLGYAIAGPLILGDEISEREEKRQKVWREVYGESVEIGDIRPGLGESIWSLGGSIWSHLRGNAARMWFLRKS